MSIEIEARNATRKEHHEKAFTAWLEKPETKLMISMIPPAENPDAMQVLLRSCFDCGYGGGEGAVAMLMIEAMLKDRPGRDSEPRNRW